MRGDLAEDVYAAGGVLDDEERIQPAQRDGVEVEQVAGQDRVALYTCKSVRAADGITSFSWAFVEPRADLVADNGQLIKHSKGPKWSAEADGSAVSLDASREVKRADSPAPDRDIPWLLVLVGPAPGASNDEGDLLTGTTFIQRLNTQGGTQPPNAECKAQTAGKVKEVPYKADYIFFK